LIVVLDHQGIATMNRISWHALPRLGFARSRNSRRRRGWTAVRYSGSGLEALEGRILLSSGVVEDLTGLPVSAEENQQFTQEVASFSDTSSLAVPSNFTATINWRDGTPTTTGAVTESIYGVFYVSGSHDYTSNFSSYTDPDLPIAVTITDQSGTTYSTSTVATPDELSASLNLPFTATQGVAFSGEVLTFGNSNPSPPAGEYTSVEINWGDGSPDSPGTVTAPCAGCTAVVDGAHTYPVVSSAGGSSVDYTVTVTIQDEDGATLLATNTMAVAPSPLTVSGTINPSSLNGQSPTSDVTNTNQPDFYGTATDLSLVTLYAMPTSGGTTIEIGSGYAAYDGSWNISSSTALPDGSYTIEATDHYDGTTSAPFTVTPAPLVVDSAASTSALPPAGDVGGPVISALTFDRSDATLTVTFQDGSSGMDLATVKDKAFYHLSASPLSKKADVLPMIRPTSIRITPGATPTSPVVAKVVFQHGARACAAVFTPS
jgi:Bacterial Ig-like domain